MSDEPWWKPYERRGAYFDETADLPQPREEWGDAPGAVIEKIDYSQEGEGHEY